MFADGVIEDLFGIFEEPWPPVNGDAVMQPFAINVLLVLSQLFSFSIFSMYPLTSKLSLYHVAARVSLKPLFSERSIELQLI